MVLVSICDHASTEFSFANTVRLTKVRFTSNKHFTKITFTTCAELVTKQFFFGVIKWFSDENATSLHYLQIEILLCRKSDDKHVESYFVKKLNFTLLYAKSVIYTSQSYCVVKLQWLIL